MRIPKKVICEFKGNTGSNICEVDQKGWGRCGDGIVFSEGIFCPWVEVILEYQDIEPVYLEGDES